MRTALVAVAILLAFPGGSPAATESSPGVRLETTIAEKGVISARAVDGHLYVSSLTGISIFDISAPRAPVRVGRLDLPNAQNEDVDVGSGILLVTDDPSGGRGVLHVVDVSDPARPRPLSTYSTWARGMEGFFDRERVPRRGGIGHTATCIDECRYAWLAGSSAGIDIVDLRDPARPRFVRRFKARAAAGTAGTHDVQVDASGLAWVAGGGGTAAYDVSDQARPRLVHRTSKRGARPPLNDGIHHNSVRLPGGVVAITEEDFRAGCRGAGSLQTWRIGGGGTLRPLDRFGVERDRSARLLCSAHYFDARDGLIAQGFYEQGVRLVDASRPRRLRQVGFYVPPRGMVWGALFAPTDPAGETVYALDHARGIDVLSVDRKSLERRPPGGPAGAQLLAARGRRPRRPPPALADDHVLRGGRAGAGTGRRGGPAPAGARERPPARAGPLRSRHARAERAAEAAVRGAAPVRRPGAGGLVGGAGHAARDDRIRARPARRPPAGRSRRGPRDRRHPHAGVEGGGRRLLQAEAPGETAVFRRARPGSA